MKESTDLPFYRIFLVEDDEKLANLIIEQCRRFRFQVQTCQSFDRVDQEVLASQAHLVLLDINLPYFNGYYWCRKIRQKSKIPILFLSARAGEMDQVLALESGGDDFISKPFHPEVLVAKLHATLRRTYGEYAELDPSIHFLEYQGLTLDIGRNYAQYQNNGVTLTRTETELLRLLLKSRGQNVNREELLSSLWDDQQFVNDNTLTVNVTRVRRKLAEIGLDNIIATVRGQGYRLDFEQQGPDS